MAGICVKITPTGVQTTHEWSKSGPPKGPGRRLQRASAGALGRQGPRRLREREWVHGLQSAQLHGDGSAPRPAGGKHDRG